MSDPIVTAMVVSIGPTLVGAAAFLQARGANRAVNHALPGEQTLAQNMVQVREDVIELRTDLIDVKEDASHLRESNHNIVSKVTASLGHTHLLAEKLDAHTISDDAAYAEIKDQLDGIAGQVNDAKTLAAEVKHDLGQYNEINILGSGGRIERRSEP